MIVPIVDILPVFVNTDTYPNPKHSEFSPTLPTISLLGPLFL